MIWQSLVEGSESRFYFRITAADMEAFVSVSGDENAVHTDDAYARQLGFDNRVVFGGLLVAKISRMIGMELPGAGGVWSGLKLDFRSPLYVDEQASLTAEITARSDSTKMIMLSLRIETDDRTIATGSAEVIYLADD